MVLVLEVVLYDGVLPAAPLHARFDQAGGSLGREAGNTLVLSDPGRATISRVHAKIHYADGVFAYADESRNGSDLIRADGTHVPLRGATAPLADGDILRIGAYELLVRIKAEAGAEGEPTLGQDRLDPRTRLFGRAGGGEATVVVEGGMPAPGVGPGLAAEAGRAAAEDRSEATILAGGKAPPAVAAPAQPVSAVAAGPAAEKAAPAGTPQTKPGAETGLFQRLLDGAGLECPPNMEADEQAEAMETLGQAFRQMVGGLMSLLEDRAREKGEIRAPATVLFQQHSNPLKHLPKAEGAMKALVFRRRYADMGYLDPVAAVQEGVADLKNHEAAMRKAMQASLRAILRTFDPAVFEALSGGGSVFQSKEAKCWKAYREAYPRLIDEAMEDVFKDVFVEEYENTVRNLREGQGKR